MELYDGKAGDAGKSILKMQNVAGERQGELARNAIISIRQYDNMARFRHKSAANELVSREKSTLTINAQTNRIA